MKANQGKKRMKGKTGCQIVTGLFHSCCLSHNVFKKLQVYSGQSAHYLLSHLQSKFKNHSSSTKEIVVKIDLQ